ncbi:MAG: hypothetical protein UR98_C0040G0039 [Parcubacteria group bacterium GW2011_GWA1_36_12]|nr:MAG: hypothetical protein UR98_C0040G0039 [Parcubacteria group bacterium GW2011_GWA1_36_12]
MNIKKGEIYLVNLAPVRSSEQGGIRPCLIIQNDISNSTSPLTIVAAITSRIKSKKFITNVFLPKESSGLDMESVILLNQIKTIDKRRIIKKIGILDIELMKKVDFALKISLGID